MTPKRTNAQRTLDRETAATRKAAEQSRARATTRDQTTTAAALSVAQGAAAAALKTANAVDAQALARSLRVQADALDAAAEAGGEVTSPEMASLAGRILRGNHSPTPSEVLAMAAALLTQAPNKAEPVAGAPAPGTSPLDIVQQADGTFHSAVAGPLFVQIGDGGFAPYRGGQLAHQRGPARSRG